MELKSQFDSHMKKRILFTVFFTHMSTYAFSMANEKCWSALPIQKKAEESKKVQDEQKLCSMDFYEGEYAICPKLESTNPAVLVVKRLVDMSNNDFENIYCKDIDDAKKAEKAKVVAKFKQTISCSDARSPVAYYRIAEFINGSRVPVAVFRTMDTQQHLDITNRALAYLAASTELIATTWKRFLQLHNSPQKYPEVFVKDTVIGALVENIKSEFIYTEVSGVGDYNGRYKRFVQQKPFLNLANPSSIASLAGGANFQKLAPIVNQMKDVSNMIIIDHMLNQADRIGNIHFKYRWQKFQNGQVESSDSKAKYIRYKDVIPNEEIANAKAGQVLIKEMFLKDNDCGISKDNEMKNIGALQSIEHISPKAYSGVQKLAAFVATEEGQTYFKDQLRINSDIFDGTKYVSGIKGNILEVAKILKSNCENGSLKLDLSLEKLLVDVNYKASCAGAE